MPKYYVNDNPQTSGEHEVHKEGCYWLGLAHSTTPLGTHSSCQSAIQKARIYYSNVDGCAYCSSECHTK